MRRRITGRRKGAKGGEHVWPRGPVTFEWGDDGHVYTAGGASATLPRRGHEWPPAAPAAWPNGVSKVMAAKVVASNIARWRPGMRPPCCRSAREEWCNAFATLFGPAQTHQVAMRQPRAALEYVVPLLPTYRPTPPRPVHALRYRRPQLAQQPPPRAAFLAQDRVCSAAA